MRIKRLRKITKIAYTEPIFDHFDADAKDEWEDIKEALLSNRCMMRFDHRKRLYLHTDYSALSFGYVALQPGDDNSS